MAGESEDFFTDHSQPKHPTKAQQEAILTQQVNAIKDGLFIGLGTDSIQQGIDKINAANTDKDKKLSTEEFVAFYQKEIQNLMAKPEMAAALQANNAAMIESCEKAGDILSTPSKRREFAFDIEKMGNSIIGDRLDEMEFRKQLAKDIKAGKLAEADKHIAQHAHDQAARTASLLQDSYPDISQSDIKAKLEPVLLSSAKTLKNVLANHPELAKNLVEMPDLSSIGYLTADNICQMQTGKGVGRVAVHAK